MKSILGVILCGGQSKRMGTDKGLLPINNTIWALYVADKLSFLHCPIVFSINEKQLKDYSHHISPEYLILDNNNFGGPLRGLLSVNISFPENDLLLLACDMLELDRFTLENVLQIYREEHQYDYYVYQDDEFAQPFSGIYTAIGLKKLHGDIQSGSLTDFSMQSVLNNGLTKRIPIEHIKDYRNFN